MKKKVVAGLLLGAMVVLAGCGAGGANTGSGSTSADAEKSDKLQVGVIQLASHVALDQAHKGFEDGLAENGLEIGKDVEIDFQNAQGDQSNLDTITKKFASDKKDLVCAIATPAAVQMASASKDIPIVGTAITDYEAAKLVKSNDKPGGNVTGTSDMNPIAEQVALLKKMVPDAKTVGMIYSSAEENSRIQSEIFTEECKKAGIKVESTTVSNVNEIQQAATNLVGKELDAVYVPTDNLLSTAIANLCSITNEKKLPVFVGEVGELNGGGLATVSVDYYELGKQAGAMAAKILKGEAKPADMPVEMPAVTATAINQVAVDTIGFEVPSDLKEFVKEYKPEKK